MVLILQERIAGLEAEMAEERHKCQRMVDQIRREIEAQATEVRAFPLNHQTTYSNFVSYRSVLT